MITVIIFLKSNLTNQKQSWLQFKHGIHFGELRRVNITWAVHNRRTPYICSVVPKLLTNLFVPSSDYGRVLVEIFER